MSFYAPVCYLKVLYVDATASETLSIVFLINTSYLERSCYLTS